MKNSAYISKLEVQNKDLRKKLEYLESLIDKRMKFQDYIADNADNFLALGERIYSDLHLYTEFLEFLEQSNSVKFELVIENIDEFCDTVIELKSLADEFMKLQVDKIDLETGKDYIDVDTSSKEVPIDREFSVTPKPNFRRF